MSTTDLREIDDSTHSIIFSDCYRVVLDRASNWDAIAICTLISDEPMLCLTVEEAERLIRALQMAYTEWEQIQKEKTL